MSVRSPFADLTQDDDQVDLSWYVLATALSALALVTSYSVMMGMVIGAVFVGVALLRAALWYWLSPERGAPPSERDALMARFRNLSKNRRLARVKERWLRRRAVRAAS